MTDSSAKITFGVFEKHPAKILKRLSSKINWSNFGYTDLSTDKKAALCIQKILLWYLGGRTPVFNLRWKLNWKNEITNVICTLYQISTITASMQKSQFLQILTWNVNLRWKHTVSEIDEKIQWVFLKKKTSSTIAKRCYQLHLFSFLAYDGFDPKLWNLEKKCKRL